ncbi:hypothetical protein AMTRI_Chr09g17400 [Amborella trichopoda]
MGENYEIYQFLYGVFTTLSLGFDSNFVPPLSLSHASLSIFSLLVRCSPFLFSPMVVVGSAIGSARKPQKHTCTCELASKMWCDECAKKLVCTNVFQI